MHKRKYNYMSKKMKGAINDMLKNVAGEELGQKIFEANFPEPLDGYMPGEILTFRELSEMPEGTIIHIHYLDECGEERESGFHPLYKHDDKEWSAGGHYPFPVDELKPETLINKIYNSDWLFTIRKAVPAKKGEFEKMKKNQRKVLQLLETMQNLSRKIHSTDDKMKKKDLKAKFKIVEKEFRKISKI